MFRRALITVMAGFVLASLCSMAQNTGTGTQSAGSASGASKQSSSSTSVQSSSTQNSSTTTVTRSSSKKKHKKSKKAQNPIANVDSKQPDKVLFDRAEDAMKHGKYDVARLSLQTLINTYPDSEYIARAKLAIGDSWYAEGGAAAMTQAESEYKDFITFFPNMPEAAEAQMKIANIHFNEMEKADRDPTHARRAEDEYRQMILQFPDSPLVPQAKERLLEVQEVLAQREYLIGHFYFLREAYPAAIARLKSVADTYPLYSGADEALYELGDAYEKEIEIIRRSKLSETGKGVLIKQYTQGAVAAYDRVLTRYPLEFRASEAKKRLEAMKQPIPKATPQAVAQDKAEIASRGSLGHVGKVMENFHRGPDVSEATKVGEPTLVDPRQTSAPDMVREATTSIVAAASGGNHVSVERVNDGTPPPENSAVPHSDAAPDSSAPAAAPGSSAPAAAPTPAAPATSDASQPGAAPAGSDMKNDLAPSVSTGPAPVPPPTQINELANGSSGGGSQPAASSSSQQPVPPADQSKESSSNKKKKKKHLLVF